MHIDKDTRRGHGDTARAQSWRRVKATATPSSSGRALSAGELEWTDGMLYPLLHRLSARVRDHGVAIVTGRASPQVLRDHRRGTSGTPISNGSGRRSLR